MCNLLCYPSCIGHNMHLKSVDVLILQNSPLWDDKGSTYLISPFSSEEMWFTPAIHLRGRCERSSCGFAGKNSSAGTAATTPALTRSEGRRGTQCRALLSCCSLVSRTPLTKLPSQVWKFSPNNYHLCKWPKNRKLSFWSVLLTTETMYDTMKFFRLSAVV